MKKLKSITTRLRSKRRQVGEEAQKLEKMKPQIQKLLEQQKKQEKLVKHVEELQKDAKVKLKFN